MSAHDFEYDRFVRIAGRELYDYMEPRIADSQFEIPQTVAEQLLSELSTYDEYHLVYALLLCYTRIPDCLIPVLPPYLAHEHDSVCSTAINLLDRMPEKYITERLIHSVCEVQDAHPERRFLADIVERLKKRHRSARR